MRTTIAVLFSLGLISFIGLWYFLLGGSASIMGVGLGLFTLVVFLLALVFSFQVLKNSNWKFSLVYMAYFSAIIILVYGLAIRISEGIGRVQHPVGLQVFYIGLGALIVLLILQFIYIIFFFDESQVNAKEKV